MQVALFVEGSSSPPPPRALPALERIWNRHLCATSGIQGFSLVVPISKKHLVAMDPENPKMSGASEPLDLLLSRYIAREAIEAAVVAWDLVPAWNPTEAMCRWDETVSFYCSLAATDELPHAWVAYARDRCADLRARRAPGSRSRVPPLVPGACLALCMEPMFEDLLVSDENAVKRALGVSGSPRGWPPWQPSPTPDRKLLTPAIAALPARSAVRRRVRGDFRTRKDDWGEYILRQLLSDDDARATVVDHPVVTRLGELLRARET